MEPNKQIAEVKHFLKKICPPLLLTVSSANGNGHSSYPFSPQQKKDPLNDDGDASDFSPSTKLNYDDEDFEEDSRAERLMLSLLKKCLNTYEANDILTKFTLTGDYSILLVELFDNEGN